MINVKKGPAHSLGQADVRGVAIAGVTAGMVCYLDGTDAPGSIALGSVPNAKTGIMGFAINNSTDGDVVESGKIALYTLDGASVIETDQVKEAITAANFPIGKPVYGEAATGKVTNVATGQVVGWVEGIRSLQVGANVTQSAQNYPSVDSQGTLVTKSYTYKGQFNAPVLSIKLASGSAAA